MGVTRIFKKLDVNVNLKNIDICNPDRIELNTSLSIKKNHFFKKPSSKLKTFDFSGYTAYPGLLNAHDHLLGTYLPKVGNGPYLNWKPWDEDLKASSLYKERSRISKKDLYLLGSYRQILSGVTTVSDHIPHRVHLDVLDECHVRVVKDFSLSHEASSYDLNWGDGLKKEIKKSRKKHLPYICHLEEGYDGEAKEGTNILESYGGLSMFSVLIHCISCDQKDIDLMAKRKVNVVWCPISNIFMFDDTANIKAFLKAGVNICIGTDSPMSGGMNLFEELIEAKKIYKKMHGQVISDQILFKMVTINSAKAFGFNPYLGSITEGKFADLIILKNDSHGDRYRQLVNAKITDLEIVFRSGIPLFFKEKYKKFIKKKKYYQKVVIGGQLYYLIGKPLDLKKRINKIVGFEKKLSFFPIFPV